MEIEADRFSFPVFRLFHTELEAVGLLELLGLVVVGQWSWQNLTTSEKRSAVVSKVQGLRKEYLG